MQFKQLFFTFRSCCSKENFAILLLNEKKSLLSTIDFSKCQTSKEKVKRETHSLRPLLNSKFWVGLFPKSLLATHGTRDGMRTKHSLQFAATTRLYRILNKPGFYRNFNREIFTRRPEFCLLYEKLQKTCHSWKREALTEKYPDLCSTIREVNESVNICPNIRNSSLLNPILFRLNGTILKLRDELFVYARDNLAVVNIYIKDATVTKIRRDQKVNAVENTNETL